MLHDGNAKGKGLSGAGGGLGHYVLPLHQAGNAAALHRGGHGVALVVQGLHQFGGQPEGIISDVFFDFNAVNFHFRPYPFYLTVQSFLV